MKTSHVNIPVFIPHLGCPNMCVFCSQRAISGVSSFEAEKARDIIEEVLSTTENSDAVREIAFFGGSFTGIDRELMIELLDIAEDYVKSGRVSGIRFSTRPDYIDDEIIEILSHYTISAAELGIQSFSDDVLTRSKRGHTAAQSKAAMTLLRQNGFSVVGQMMIGLPGSTIEDEIMTAESICACGASASRIYPTVVFRNTELCGMAEIGEYTPLTVEEAVERSAAVLDVFVKNGVECLRIGLCESENLHSDSLVHSGANHPALGEEVYGELYFRRVCEQLERYTTDELSGKTAVIEVPSGEISKAVGQKKKNKLRILGNYPIRNIKFIENSRLARYNISLTIHDR